MVNLVVETKNGKVEGFEVDGMYKWFGIPYAKPPVEELRFKRSVPCDNWNGIKHAGEFGNRPYQFATMGGIGKDMKTVPESEDCLYLNVWAPKQAKKSPVFVWIYGGANTVGEGSDPHYFGESFTKDDIIYVNFNYRVGPLGFYNFSIYDDSFDSNCAVSDMINALKWVKENIEVFGGDPDNITIAGESAGGTAVYSMLSAPSAKGLFNKAIAQSGLAGNISTPKTQQLNIGLFIEQMNMKKEELNKLKTMPIEKMYSAAEYVYQKNCDSYPGILIAGPVIDDLIPMKPWEAMANGSAEGVDVIFGTCHDEGSLFYNMKMFPRNWDQVEKMLALSGCSEKLEGLKRLYKGKSKKKAMMELGRDRAFWADYIKCIQAQCTHGKTYAYRFDFVTVLLKLMGLNATHGSDVGPALDIYVGALDKFTPKKRIDRIHKYMHGAWVNFAKNGVPNGTLPMLWEPYTDEKRTTFIFNNKCSIEYNPGHEAFEVWKDIKIYD
ncbi:MULTISPECIES: carboxylesterase/lipase family protein [Clostridium]|uniref:Carboxylic ester hydrolase n=1 Tax=Clostridium frigoriphilum TaxID=443253 RepID=A0ABU7URV4_9CLOT|nr:carboxylesterase/lipase family protein [Clostridium sp. DSM 17811]MBU3099400.1 carboxylesterase/lipase family protein [Clostridium sp. DSM 17811]